VIMGLGATTLGWASWYFLPSVLVEGKGLSPGLSAAAGDTGPKDAVCTYVHGHILLTGARVGKGRCFGRCLLAYPTLA
jgi:hypothetical protein